MLLALEFEAFPGDATLVLELLFPELGVELVRELFPPEPAFACLIRPLLPFEFEALELEVLPRVLDDVLLFEAVLLDAPGAGELELLLPFEPGVGLVAGGVVLY